MREIKIEEEVGKNQNCGEGGGEFKNEEEK